MWQQIVRPLYLVLVPGLVLGFALLYDFASGQWQAVTQEFADIERLKLPAAAPDRAPADADKTRVFQQWHTVTLSFEGPATSEQAGDNPFTNTRLLVTFTQGDESYTVRGFYAADGNAGQTGADAGNVWQARFTPDRTGEWTYAASLRSGTGIAIDDDPDAGAPVILKADSGRFLVTGSDKTGPDFRAHGRLVADGGYFQFRDSGEYWLKGGANSPENFLAYRDFDGTYRASRSMRDGEAAAGEGLHEYSPHLGDWREGDPRWQGEQGRGERGKGIVGAINYLASTGMNAVYFLTMNIGGDGNDVWPYTDHDERQRFDCSKLAQWEIVFQHMQERGVLLHLVTQETENERLLAGGAGVEWYFGARYPANDLTSEDWRLRAGLWRLTRHALDFFAAIPYWTLHPCNDLVDETSTYCLGKPGEIYVLYWFGDGDVAIELQGAGSTYSVLWYDPIRGGALRHGSKPKIAGGRRQLPGEPPEQGGSEQRDPEQRDKDWVILLKRE